MSRQTTVLKSLVALKRQKAEQDVLGLQLDLRRVEADIAGLSFQLRNMDTSGEGFGADALARQHGHVEKLVADISQRKAALVTLEGELEAARDALRQVMHSENRLDEM